MSYPISGLSASSLTSTGRAGLFVPVIPGRQSYPGDGAFACRLIGRRIRNENRNSEMLAVRQPDDADVIGRGGHSLYGIGRAGLVRHEGVFRQLTLETIQARRRVGHQLEQQLVSLRRQAAPL